MSSEAARRRRSCERARAADIPGHGRRRWWLRPRRVVRVRGRAVSTTRRVRAEALFIDFLSLLPSAVIEAEG
jgi:hypothetical protein